MDGGTIVLAYIYSSGGGTMYHWYMYIQTHTVDDDVVFVLFPYARLFLLFLPLSMFRGSHNCLIVGGPFFSSFFLAWNGMAVLLLLLCVQEPILRLTPTSLPPSRHIVVH